LDFCEQAGEVDGFGVVVVAAGGEGFFAVACHGVCGEGDHGDFAELWVGFDSARGFPTVDLREAHVHEDKIWSERFGLGNGGGAVLGRPDFVSASRQSAREHVAVECVVFRQKNLWHGWGLSGLGGGF